MNPEKPQDYSHRCFTALGQGAHDPEQVTNWCYDNPPRKPLPKIGGMRERQIWLSRRIFLCLGAAAGQGHIKVEALAESILALWINANMPDVYAMYERHEQEVNERLKELRQQEPQLQTQEEV